MSTETANTRSEKTRSAYRERREAQLREWLARLDAWQARADRRKADAKIRYEETLDDLRARIERTRKGLGDLREAGEGAWQDLKTGVDEAFDDLREAFERAASKFDR